MANREERFLTAPIDDRGYIDMSDRNPSRLKQSIAEIRRGRRTVAPVTPEDVLVDEIDRLTALIAVQEEFIKNIASRCNAAVSRTWI